MRLAVEKHRNSQTPSSPPHTRPPWLKDRPTLFHRAACWEKRYCSSLAANTEGLPDSVSSKSTLSRW